MYIYIYIYVYTCIHTIYPSPQRLGIAVRTRTPDLLVVNESSFVVATATGIHRLALRPISRLTLPLLTLLDSNFPGNSLWAWESHPLQLRLSLSQTL